MSQTTLKRGVLSFGDVMVSGLANIGPAMSLFFGAAFLAATVGSSIPFEVMVAGIAVLTLGNTMAQFSKSIPSAGSFVTFISRTFGGAVGTASAFVIVIGYIIAIAGVIAVLGGWVSAILSRDLGLHVPWLAVMIIGSLGITALLLRGVKVSSFWAIVFFFFEAGVLLLLAGAILIKGGAQGISAVPLTPSGASLGALATAFPLVMFMFVGWENSGALAEETADPRRNVPRAIFFTILIVAVLFILSSYAAVLGFGPGHIDLMAKDEAPFDTLGRQYLGPFRVLVDLAGLTSIVATIVAAGNSQTRILFHAGREHLLPSIFGRVHGKNQTPHVAIYTYMGVATLLALLLGLKFDANTTYGYLTTLGTIPLILMYAVSNLALPWYYLKVHREQFGWVRHLLVPIVGLVILVWPFWQLVQPEQEWPMNWFPWITLAIVLAGIGWTWYRLKKFPEVSEKAGSILADSQEH
ncbi:APC family permease [Kyrpidia spormannii]|uniref:APC family permease n=2 Tax=Kyrpidia spormannii TaxID=2055160 RepID=A0ACA8Z814_9BACL|nr:APC family permease [Kyrpidia spormannii]CAB3390247.1 APC family permease [Kyrpidia spormannii]CAB3391170.1 APC family permease [Kyrpidia spormannii]